METIAKKKVYFTGLVSIALLYPLSSHADLNNVPGMNEIQARTAAMIQDICPKMVTISDELTESQTSLLEKCGALVHTSNAQQESGRTTLALPYNEGELRDALQDIAHEELSTHGTLSTEALDTHVANIASRLSAIHRGNRLAASSGVSLSLLGVPSEDYAQWQDDNLPITGGGAGSDSASGLSMYINGKFNFGEKEATSREDAFDYDAVGVTIGGDMQISDQLLVGLGLGYSSSETDLQWDGDNASSETYSLNLYASKYLKNDFYIDGIFTFGQGDYESERHITFAQNVVTDTISGDTEGQQISLNLGIGKDFQLSASGVSVTTYANVGYSDLTIDAYSEESANASALELQVQEQSITSLTSTLGVQISDARSFSQGVWVPQMMIEYHHEFKDDSRNINARYVNDPFGDSFFSVSTDDADSNYFGLGLGASVVLQNGQQLFAYYERTLGLDNLDDNLVTFGYRGEL